MRDALSVSTVLGVLFSYPAYLLIMAGVLRACGVPRKEIAKWVLRQADRQRVADLVRSFRHGPAVGGEPQRGSGGEDALVVPDKEE